MKETRIYKHFDNGSIQADIYDQGNKSPVIVYIHGGALIFGSKAWLPDEQIEYFKKSGFSVVNIDYRLAPETKLDAIVEDVRDAMLWVRSQASEWYDFDTENVAVMGGSAGGYLSLFTGVMGEKVKPKAIVSFYGYGDMLGEWYAKPSDYYCERPIIEDPDTYIGNKELTQGAWERFNYYLYCRQQGVWVEKVTGVNRHNLEKLQRYNPIDHVSSDFPPTLFLHGNRDTDVPYEQSVMMYKKLKEKGVPTELITMEGADHVFDQHFQEPTVQDAFRIVVDFLHLHLSR